MLSQLKMIIRNKEIIFFIEILIISSILIFGCSSHGNLEKRKEGMTIDSIGFIYTDIIGIGVDSLSNRRDPSDIIKVGGRYYVWYTKMVSPVTSGYWATIWYATSEDEGFTWNEQGLALGVGLNDEFDSHSVFTPNILVYDGKYYLYYTGVKPTHGNPTKEFEGNSTNDFTAIGLAVSDSPDGPFERVKINPVLEISKEPEDFDSYRVDDAALIVKESKIWLYYKGRSIIHGKDGPKKTKMGVAIAEDPVGPFKKHIEPLIDRGHEVLIWNFNRGIATLTSLNKKIQYSSDGLNFSPIQDNLNNIPMAPGLYRPHLEDGNKMKEFPGWGIAMRQKKGLTYLVRFEMNN